LEVLSAIFGKIRLINGRLAVEHSQSIDFGFHILVLPWSLPEQ
jgi:hypothetical protein